MSFLIEYRIKNKIIFPPLSSFSYNDPNYYDSFNGLKRNWFKILKIYSGATITVFYNLPN
ncbi:hypothetical protein BpHYR1_004907 [Brachionus plicatilis]|uniref:Uncharacterized protein n=1 Tax=Brachionus plicatilis TaxID=10195 RepID=A0A3M7RQJ7_BRAPC|nr:hypothetical protein BpHYR1_004907 [Brachionus plicatilis]